MCTYYTRNALRVIHKKLVTCFLSVAGDGFAGGVGRWKAQELDFSLQTFLYFFVFESSECTT